MSDQSPTPRRPDVIRDTIDEIERDYNSAERAEHIAKSQGCVANPPHEGGKLTIWKSGNRFTLSEFGCFGKTLPQTYDPVFQSIARELERLAHEVGALRRKLVDRAFADHRARKAIEPPPELDATDGEPAATDPPEWVAEDAPAPEVAPDPIEREEPPGVEELNEVEQAERDEELRAVDDYARAAIRRGEYPG